MPHCDSAVLHAPKWALDVGALVSQDGRRWALCIHRTGEAPWRVASEPTSLAGHAPEATPRFVIPLTQRAWSALLSRATTTAPSTSEPNPSRVSVGGVELGIVRDGALSAWLDGDATTHQPRSDAPSSRDASASVWPRPERTSDRFANSPVATVDAVFRGTSWSLTIARAGETPTRLSLESSPQGASAASVPSWLSAIWSALTAIAPELTTERWQQERERLSRGECRYCDARPEWQQLRQLWGIAFTGRPPRVDLERPWLSEVPCPSDARRPGGANQVWPGNQPEAHPGG